MLMFCCMLLVDGASEIVVSDISGLKRCPVLENDKFCIQMTLLKSVI